ncbi:ADP-ribosylation factor GTPase-activating 1-like [Solea senegalensis]|uniref:ADP-ribosylation factor GTPase-activating 1-like n=1 Tax=Solea senegalensis TaxID=28829 RepID=A0AAV6PCP1_SOLSE|nr:ADP-ribosylation factor GTPase-activating 1-like [Solea senegalensis]
MIIRLGRLTPGYFRLLQRQVAGEVQLQPQDRAVNQIAMMLAIMGLSLSYYSTKQMMEKVQRQQRETLTAA